MGLGIFNAGALLPKLKACQLVQSCAGCGDVAADRPCDKLEPNELERILEGRALNRAVSCKCPGTPRWVATLWPPELKPAPGR